MSYPEDELAIIQLYAEYNRALDAGEAEQWCATFLPDGLFEHPERLYRGANELHEFVVSRKTKIATSPVEKQQHWNDPITVDIDGCSATASCSLLVSGIDKASGEAVVVVHGQYVDSLAKTPSGWRFHKRKLTVA